MKRFISLFLFSLIISNTLLFSQSSESDNQDITFQLSAKDSQSQSFLHENDGKKHWFTAVGAMLFFNVGLASYNRFVLGSGWAQVGPEQWNHFWERAMSYDKDWYWTNFVLHPYQGSIYYMASRSSNLNVLESFGVTLLGSSFWEYLCETNAPSKNDMFYTSVGSFALGEMLYRLSLNADELSSLFGLAINPTRVWTQAWTRQKPSETTRNIHELYLKFNVGTGRAYSEICNSNEYDYNQHEIYPFYFNPSIYLSYNDPYGHDSNQPYSQFELEISASAGKGSGYGAKCHFEELDKNLMYDIRIMSNGMLFARAPELSETTDTTLGFVMEYQFDWHQFYMLTALGPGLALKQRFRFEKSVLEWQLHGAWNAMGTTDYYYYHRTLVDTGDYLMRDYNMTTGPMSILKVRYISEKGKEVNYTFRGYGMLNYESQKQTSVPFASTGWEWIGVSDLGFEVPLSKRARIGVNDELYLKKAFYKDMPDIFQYYNSASIYAKLQVK